MNVVKNVYVAHCKLVSFCCKVECIMGVHWDWLFWSCPWNWSFWHFHSAFISQGLSLLLNGFCFLLESPRNLQSLLRCTLPHYLAAWHPVWWHPASWPQTLWSLEGPLWQGQDDGLLTPQLWPLTRGYPGLELPQSGSLALHTVCRCAFVSHFRFFLKPLVTLLRNSVV